MTFKGFRLWALGFVFTIFATAAQGSPKMAIKKINLPRIPESVDARRDLPRRDAPLRVAALRVEFVRDTLSTTTGDGGFDYGQNDSFYFDPPPHDSLYFADHIEFQNFYWDKMSVGNLGFKCEVFPACVRAAYQLPKQMWQYNYNNGAAQLDKGLAELFRDAVQEADSDAAIVWNNYDLIIIFHAGAGAEFDLGFSSTPHDLPSAWMVKEDFRSQLNLPDGIPIDNNTGFVASGLILPETETHEGVQISMAGVISLMIGHWLGLPALYDKDEGDPVVGKWSMMDRGFGNFYGALPGPVDVWSASHMGWTAIGDAATGGNRIMARFHQYMENDTAPPRSLKVSVSSQEEFIFECRFRDPENDSVAYAWDRDGRRMTFKDDYSVEVEPGFRVPVRADDLDFDSPGSGIVIWHHDSGLDNLIDEGRFNSVDELRGLDIEEADGAQDIGRNYPFLTPGYGTDYGIFEDAWYGDNSAYRDANRGQSVSFNDDSYPNSRSNSGAFTHVKVDSISRRGNVMGFRFKKTSELFSIKLPASSDDFDFSNFATVGNFIGPASQKEICLLDDDSIRFFDLQGNQYSSLSHQGRQPVIELIGNSVFSARDLNNDGITDIIWGVSEETPPRSIGKLSALISDVNNNWQLIDFADFQDALSLWIACGGSIGESEILVTTIQNGSSWVYRYQADLTLFRSDSLPRFNDRLQYPLSIHRLGSTSSDTFLIVTTINNSLFLSTDAGLQKIDRDPTGTYSYLMRPIVADFDGSGYQDVVVFQGGGNPAWITIHDLLTLNAKANEFHSFNPMHYVFEEPPYDVNDDGRFDVIINRLKDHGLDMELNAFEQNGMLVEGYPKYHPTGKDEFNGNRHVASLDLGNGSRLVVRGTTFSIGDSADFNDAFKPNYHFYDCLLNDEISLPGFPIESESGWIRFAEIDSIPGYDLIIASTKEIKAYSLPTSRWPNQSIWWQGSYRDNDNSNAIWEPATPFAAASGAKLLEENLCYNWPNPAKGESTAIRYTLNFPGTVSVEIFDIAGDKVASLSGTGEAGVPNEIIWNLTNVARGAYLAVVEATGSGKTERKTVKIAVVK